MRLVSSRIILTFANSYTFVPFLVAICKFITKSRIDNEGGAIM